MARIAGVDLPRDKRVEIGLTYVFGMGRTRSRETLVATGIHPDIRVRDLSEEQVKQLRDHIEASYQIEGDLRREIAQSIKRKVDIGSYQGIRHRRGLPVRGQRTHTNARTRKGRRQAVGGIKKKQRKH
jgi:small subunit ribosomal protein S13